MLCAARHKHFAYDRLLDVYSLHTLRSANYAVCTRDASSINAAIRSGILPNARAAARLPVNNCFVFFLTFCSRSFSLVSVGSHIDKIERACLPQPRHHSTLAADCVAHLVGHLFDRWWLVALLLEDAILLLVGISIAARSAVRFAYKRRAANDAQSPTRKPCSSNGNNCAVAAADNQLMIIKEEV